ncbi:MAG: GH25 family lysozyme [Anaerolineaceae bacterium]
MSEVIDLSYANGKFNWSKAVAKGVDSAYLKASQRNFPDPMFKTNIESAPDGFPVGAYFYIDYTLKHYAAGKEIEFGKDQASKAAEIVLPYLLTGKLGITIWDGKDPKTERDATLSLDVEDNSGSGWERITPENVGRVMAITLAFKQKLEQIIWETEKKKRIVGTYSNCTLVQSMRNFKDGLLWLAWYTSLFDPGYVKKLANGTVYYASGAWMGDWFMHQYSSRGDGQAYGNSVGNQWIDLNRVNEKWQILRKSAPEVERPPITHTLEEKVQVMWLDYLERKGN